MISSFFLWLYKSSIANDSYVINLLVTVNYSNYREHRQGGYDSSIICKSKQVKHQLCKMLW